VDDAVVVSGDAVESEEETETYLTQVRRQIDEEVRRRRASGEFPPSFERHLDELFARFTPVGEKDDQFTESLKLADRSSYFDIKVPLGSRKAVGGVVKHTLWRTQAWFHNYVSQQLNHFSSAVMRVLHLLDERLSDVEQEVALLAPEAILDETLLSVAPDVSPWIPLVVETLGAPSSSDGVRHRVLHAESGDGVLLGALVEAGFDAYGIDPGPRSLAASADGGLDVRRDDVLVHLGHVADEALGGLVLSACVDRLSSSERRKLVALVEAKLIPGASCVVLGTMPHAWERTVSPIEFDLALGRPYHPETWGHLLRQQGLGDVGIRLGQSNAALASIPDDESSATEHNANLVVLNDLLFGPSAYAVVATKPG